MMHSRSALEKKRRLAADVKTHAETAEKEANLRQVQQHFPEVARVCHIVVKAKHPKGGDALSSSQMGLERAGLLIRASYLDSVPRGLGVGHSRLVDFASSLAYASQVDGLADILKKCAIFRASSNQSWLNVVIIGFSHESDSTHQSVAQHLIQKVGRPASKRLATEVINQRGNFAFLLMRCNRQTAAIIHEEWFRFDWHCFSVVILEKTAPFIRRALQLGMPFQLGEDEWDTWNDALVAACDTLVIDQHGDKGSNNAPAFRDLACVVGEMGKSMNDISVCEIHVLQGIKNSVQEIKFDVGKMYCLSNVSRVASFHNSLVNSIIWLAHNTVRRIIAKPPASETEDMHLLLNALYDFEAEHHKRSGGKVSNLLVDLKGMAAMPLYEVPGVSLGPRNVVRVHFCWNHETGGPCCSDDEDCYEKVAVHNINFHASTAFDQVSLSRFTHVAKARKRLIVGMTNQRLYISAASFCALKVIDPSNQGVPTIPAMESRPEEMGSGEGDLKITMQTRCERLHEWFNSPGIYYRLPIAEATETILDKLQYAFFGLHGRSVSAAVICNPSTSPVAEALSGLWRLASTWTSDKHGAWKVLVLSGWKDFSDDRVRMCARSHCLGLLAGLVHRFDMKFSNLPWTLARLVSESWSDEAKQEICNRLCEARACCLPLFAREFKNLYPTAEQMRSPHGLGTVRVWLEGKRLSTKSSELGHSSERRALHAANAPGRAFIPHSRRDFMQKHRLSHISRKDCDPTAQAEMRATAGSPSQGALPTAPDPWHKLLPPVVLQELEDSPKQALQDLLHDVAATPLHHAAFQLALPSETSLAACADRNAQGPEASVQMDTISKRSGSGGSIYLVHLNRCRNRFKASIGGRKMSVDEKRAIEQQAREEFGRLSGDELDAYQTLYARQVRQRQRGERATPLGSPASTAIVATEVSNAPVFLPGFDSKSSALPIEPQRFCSVV